MIPPRDTLGQNAPIRRARRHCSGPSRIPYRSLSASAPKQCIYGWKGLVFTLVASLPRILDIDDDHGSGDDRFLYDVQMSGLLAGVVFEL